MSFASDVAKYAEKIGASLDETGRAIALELFGSVVKSTPVASGRAKGSWQATIGSPASGDPQRDESAALSEIRREAGQFSMGKVIYLASNLVYIGKLEFGLYPGGGPKTTADGFSTQAPAGMARTNAARIQSIVRKAVAENKV